MPTPRITENRVQQAALPDRRVSTDAPVEAFGGGVSKVTGAAQDLGNTVVNIQAKEIEKANQISVTEALANLEKDSNDLLYDPKQGFINKRQKDAIGSAQDYEKRYGDTHQKHRAGLSNDAQRAAYDQTSLRVRNSFDNNINKHLSKEMFDYDKTVHSSAVAEKIRTAVLNSNDPDIVASKIEEIEVMSMEYALRNGLDESAAVGLAREATSKTHAAVIDQLTIQGKDIDAENYYKAIEDELTTDDIKRLSPLIEEGSRLGRTQRRGDSIMDMGLPKTEALDLVRRTTSGKDEKALIAEIKTRYEEKETNKTERTNFLRDKVRTGLIGNGGNIKDPALLPYLLEMTPSERENAESTASYVLNGPEGVDNLKTIKSISDTARNNPKKFIQLDFDAMYEKGLLSRSTREKFNQAKFDEKNRVFTVDSINSEKEQIKQIGLDAGIGEGDADAFVNQVDMRIREESQRLKRKLSTKEKDDIAKDHLVKIKDVDFFGDFFGDTSEPVFLFNNADWLGDPEIAPIKYKDIPARAEEQIKRYLKSQNIRVDVDAIREAYRSWWIPRMMKRKK